MTATTCPKSGGEPGRDGFHSVPVFPRLRASAEKIRDGVESVPTGFMDPIRDSRIIEPSHEPSHESSVPKMGIQKGRSSLNPLDERGSTQARGECLVSSGGQTTPQHRL